MVSCNATVEETVVFQSNFTWKVKDFDDLRPILKFYNEREIVSPSFQTLWQDTFVIKLRFFAESGKYYVKASPKLDDRVGSYQRTFYKNIVYFCITAFMNSDKRGVSIFNGLHDSTSDDRLNLWNEIEFAKEKCCSLQLRIKMELVVDVLSYMIHTSLTIPIEEQFQNFAESGDHSLDLIIRVGETELKANKLALCDISPVFSAMFRNQFVEEKNSVVNIRNFDVDTVKLFLTYAYICKFGPVCRMSPSGQVTGNSCTCKQPEFKGMMNVANLYCMAEQYQVPVLKTLCETYVNSQEDSIKQLLNIVVSM